MLSRRSNGSDADHVDHGCTPEVKDTVKACNIDSLSVADERINSLRVTKELISSLLENYDVDVEHNTNGVYSENSLVSNNAQPLVSDAVQD